MLTSATASFVRKKKQKSIVETVLLLNYCWKIQRSRGTSTVIVNTSPQRGTIVLTLNFNFNLYLNEAQLCSPLGSKDQWFWITLEWLIAWNHLKFLAALISNSFCWVHCESIQFVSLRLEKINRNIFSSCIFCLSRAWISSPLRGWEVVLYIR